MDKENDRHIRGSCLDTLTRKYQETLHNTRSGRNVWKIFSQFKTFMVLDETTFVQNNFVKYIHCPGWELSQIFQINFKDKMFLFRQLKKCLNWSYFSFFFSTFFLLKHYLQDVQQNSGYFCFWISRLPRCLEIPYLTFFNSPFFNFC